MPAGAAARGASADTADLGSRGGRRLLLVTHQVRAKGEYIAKAANISEERIRHPSYLSLIFSWTISSLLQYATDVIDSGALDNATDSRPAVTWGVSLQQTQVAC